MPPSVSTLDSRMSWWLISGLPNMEVAGGSDVPATFPPKSATFPAWSLLTDSYAVRMCLMSHTLGCQGSGSDFVIEGIGSAKELRRSGVKYCDVARICAGICLPFNYNHSAQYIAVKYGGKLMYCKGTSQCAIGRSFGRCMCYSLEAGPLFPSMRIAKNGLCVGVTVQTNQTCSR